MRYRRGRNVRLALLWEDDSKRFIENAQRKAGYNTEKSRADKANVSGCFTEIEVALEEQAKALSRLANEYEKSQSMDLFPRDKAQLKKMVEGCRRGAKLYQDLYKKVFALALEFQDVRHY